MYQQTKDLYDNLGQICEVLHIHKFCLIFQMLRLYFMEDLSIFSKTIFFRQENSVCHNQKVSKILHFYSQLNVMRKIFCYFLSWNILWFCDMF